MWDVENSAQIKKSDWNRPPEDNGGGVMSSKLQSRRYQHPSSHENNSWISIHKRKWLWDGSEIQLRACVNTGEQKGRINEQKGLGGISLDEMAGNKEDWGICISYTACAVADPSGQLCEGLQWPLPLRAYTAPVAAAASPQLSQQRSL